MTPFVSHRIFRNEQDAEDYLGAYGFTEKCPKCPYWYYSSDANVTAELKISFFETPDGTKNAGSATIFFYQKPGYQKAPEPMSDKYRAIKTKGDNWIVVDLETNEQVTIPFGNVIAAMDWVRRQDIKAAFLRDLTGHSQSLASYVRQQWDSGADMNGILSLLIAAGNLAQKYKND